MSRPHPPIPGLDVMVPPIALGLGLLTGLVVYRHAAYHQIQSPLLWGGFIGGCFFFAPILLTPYLIPVYYSLFIPSSPGLLVKPVHALATIIGGGGIAGFGAILLYSAHFVRQRDVVST